MTETILTEQDRASIKKLFRLFHERAREKGFHKMTDALREEYVTLQQEGMSELASYILSVHRGNRLALIGDEIVEAREEIRKGKLPAEVYTSETDETKAAKPEGYLSEMADVFIRLGDTLAEEDYYMKDDFIEMFLDMVETKVSFNQARSLRNGGKTF